jgi:hypothetical protein
MQHLHTVDEHIANEEWREFARVVRRALLLVVRYLEKRYHLCD